MTDRRRAVTSCGRLAVIVPVLVTLLASGCDSGGHDTPWPVALQTVAAGRPAPATDLFEVWVCRVPTDTTDPLYADVTARLTLTAGDVVQQIAAGVGAYWSTVSHDAYRPTFTAGGAFDIASTDTSQHCIDQALTRSGSDADAVLVVADAQHASDQPGGRSTPGAWPACTAHCAARTSGRFVYVGANDFFTGVTAPMPLDLVEHELGHSLGLPHSGDVVGATGNKGVGPYDVMANSAAAREVDPSRRDAPDLLAIDRVALGWLPRDAVRVAPASTETTTLAPSTGATGATGTRLVVIPIDEHRFVTVELLTSDGFDDHLDGAGVVVHMIDDSPEQCGATTRCTGPDRVQQIVAADGSEHTLLSAGDRITVDQWNIDVDQISADGDAITAQVTVGRAAPAQE